MLSLRPVAGYLDHLLHAKGKHGVQSPFVYELVTEVFPARKTHKSYRSVEQLRQDLLDDDRIIQVHDLGAGSKVSKNDRRAVREILKHSSGSRKDCELLARLAEFMKPGSVLELGTNLGITSSYLALAAPEASVTTIEGCKNIHAIATENFARLGLERINAICGSFDDHLDSVLLGMNTVDLIYLGGNHRYEPTMKYFEECLPYLHSSSVMIFDDIHWSKEMERAWNEISADERVKVSIDLFNMGLIFTERDQAKEHFRIRI